MKFDHDLDPNLHVVDNSAVLSDCTIYFSLFFSVEKV